MRCSPGRACALPPRCRRGSLVAPLLAQAAQAAMPTRSGRATSRRRPATPRDRADGTATGLHAGASGDRCTLDGTRSAAATGTSVAVGAHGERARRRPRRRGDARAHAHVDRRTATDGVDRRDVAASRRSRVGCHAARGRDPTRSGCASAARASTGARRSASTCTTSGRHGTRKHGAARRARRARAARSTHERDAAVPVHSARRGALDAAGRHQPRRTGAPGDAARGCVHRVAGDGRPLESRAGAAGAPAPRVEAPARRRAASTRPGRRRGTRPRAAPSASRSTSRFWITRLSGRAP